MKLLLCYALWGYLPKWKVIKEVPLTAAFGSKGTRYILQCEQTGKIRMKDCI